MEMDPRHLDSNETEFDQSPGSCRKRFEIEIYPNRESSQYEELLKHVSTPPQLEVSQLCINPKIYIKKEGAKWC